MTLERYDVRISNNSMSFLFDSIGPKGKIPKMIEYKETKNKNVYNLGFGDYDHVSNKINDKNITDNKDRDKVLTTVALSLYEFTNKYPEALVFVIGSTDSRTRLYQIEISKYLDVFSNDFKVYGLINNKWELFLKNKNYTAFLAQRK